MERVKEPELMDNEEQVIAYANANFDEPHNHFLKLLNLAIGKNFPSSGNVIDLGTGAADITIKFALTYPSFKIDAVDGSKAMLVQAEKAIDKFDLNHRINLIHTSIQNISLIEKEYEIILSNSLLHHLHDPTVLWQLVKRAKGDPIIFIMDLMRPKNMHTVNELVHKYAKEEPEILQRDFRNSLKAAFTPEEVVLQLEDAKLESLKVSIASDRHIVVSSY